MTETEYWHGTANGYVNRRCRCADCREAWRIYYAERRRRRRPADWKPKPRQRYDPVCTVPGCERPHDSRGFCVAHVGRLRRAEAKGVQPDMTAPVGEMFRVLSDEEIAEVRERVEGAANALTIYALMWLVANPEAS